MAFYSATVKDATGLRRTMLREAESRAACVAALRAEGLLVVAVEENAKRGGLPGRWHPAWLLPMTSFDVEIGLRQLSSMLKSGVSLVTGLETVGEQARRPLAKRTWFAVREAVLAGTSLAEAMERQKRRFGDMAICLARVGEQSGELDTALQRAADQMEMRRTLRGMVVNALIYPTLALLMTVGVSVFLVTVVIPKIAAFLQSGNVPLPHMTQMLVDISEWTLAHGVALAVGAVGTVVAWFGLRAIPQGHEVEDVFLLYIPVVGRILRLSATAVASRALQMMLMSGVGLLDALAVTARLMGNRRYRRRLEAAREQVLQGASLALALEGAREFPMMLQRMTAVGETTGALADAFGETARFHEMMLNVAIKRLGVLIEPVMIGITGFIVGFVYVAFFVAVFSLASAG